MLLDPYCALRKSMRRQRKLTHHGSSLRASPSFAALTVRFAVEHPYLPLLRPVQKLDRALRSLLRHQHFRPGEPIASKEADALLGTGSMDREMELAHLAQAEKAVIEGERHIQHQERVVAELDRDGHDTREALALLAAFRRIQAEHVAHRDFLLRKIAEPTGHHVADGKALADRSRSKSRTRPRSGRRNLHHKQQS